MLLNRTASPPWRLAPPEPMSPAPNKAMIPPMTVNTFHACRSNETHSCQECAGSPWWCKLLRDSRHASSPRDNLAPAFSTEAGRPSVCSDDDDYARDRLVLDPRGRCPGDRPLARRDGGRSPDTVAELRGSPPTSRCASARERELLGTSLYHVAIIEADWLVDDLLGQPWRPPSSRRCSRTSPRRTRNPAGRPRGQPGGPPRPARARA